MCARLASARAPPREISTIHGALGPPPGVGRTGAVAHARILERRGFGVLVYDARGRGKSDGSPSGYGWGRSKDVEGALDYLAGRADVDPARIGGLGLSTGGDVLLEVAPGRPRLAAVVTDGAAAMTWQDGQRLGSPPIEAAAGWTMFQAIALLTAEARPRVLEDRVAAMRAPLLLISAGRAAERDFNALYKRSAGGPVEHWNLPGTAHTRGLREWRADYERHVAAFLEIARADTRTNSP